LEFFTCFVPSGSEQIASNDIAAGGAEDPRHATGHPVRCVQWIRDIRGLLYENAGARSLQRPSSLGSGSKGDGTKDALQQNFSIT
jgi:hypothetical protein